MEIQIDENKKKQFAGLLLDWFEENKRGFPWRYQQNPFYIWISEMLLQQTDAQKALYAYESIIKSYPDISKLSEASDEDLGVTFSKIGLNYRVERIKTASQYLCEHYNGIFPHTMEELLKIKGVGDYIASAIMCFAYNESCAVVDTNVIRIIEKVFGFKSNISRPRNDKSLWQFANSIVDKANAKDYNYAILDFGALVCTHRLPKCGCCPMIYICDYFENYLEGL